MEMKCSTCPEGKPCRCPRNIYTRDIPSYRGDGSGGLKVTAQMRSIIQKPGFLSIAKGGQTLRELYVDSKLCLHRSPYVNLLT